MVINSDEFRTAVVDVETDILNTEDQGFKASPFYSDNEVVLLGVIDDEGDEFLVQQKDLGLVFSGHLFSHNMLVGHNIKFDLLYLMKTFGPQEYEDWIRSGGTVWDTMVVEYLLSGQDNKMPSLNSVSEKYGGTQKIDKIKEYWDAGVNTRDIPMDELSEYLHFDLENTRLVFEEQWKAVEKAGMLPLVLTQMDALLALASMEWNGFVLDRAEMNVAIIKKYQELRDLEKELKLYIEDAIPTDHTFKNLTPRSPIQVSLTIFGGEYEREVIKEVRDDKGVPIRYKSGKKKGQIKTKKHKEKGIVGTRFDPSWINAEKGKNGHYSVDDETLHTVSHATGVATGIKQFCEKMMQFRSWDKDLNTYYLGYLRECWYDGKLHPNFNQALTATGRLSCNKPNLQNLSKKEF